MFRLTCSVDSSGSSPELSPEATSQFERNRSGADERELFFVYDLCFSEHEGPNCSKSCHTAVSTQTMVLPLGLLLGSGEAGPRDPPCMLSQLYRRGLIGLDQRPAHHGGDGALVLVKLFSLNN
ncbi:hypothetical protein INR49_029627 [Caranx melampygus]|nr:hypothetical protein INR49_029627 [Caranx melampygus]